MQIIRTAEDFARLLATHADPDLRSLLKAQADRLTAYVDYDLSELAMFAIVEPGDDLNSIDSAIGWSLLDGDTFSRPVEIITQVRGWYEVTFILSDDGFGLVLYVPDIDGTNRQLLAACEQALSERQETRST